MNIVTGRPTSLRRSSITLVLGTLVVLCAMLLTATPAPAYAPAETALHLLAPLGDAPDKLDDGEVTDLGLLPQITIQACRVTDSGCEVVSVHNSGTRDAGRIRIDKGRDAYRLDWEGEDFDVQPGDTIRFDIRVAGLLLGNHDVAMQSDEDDGFEADDKLKIRFRIDPNPEIRVRSLHDARRTASEVWEALSEEFPELTVSEKYVLLRDDLRTGDVVLPYREWFGDNEDRCRSFEFRYDDGHVDVGMWCDNDKDVTPEGFPRLHVASLHLSCSEHFDDGVPSKGKSDIGDHTVTSWQIIDHHKDRSCGTPWPLLLDPEEPFTPDAVAAALTAPDRGALTAAEAAATMADDFSPVVVLGGLVRSPYVSPSALELMAIAEDVLGIATPADAAVLLAELRNADGTRTFTAADIITAFMERTPTEDDPATLLDTVLFAAGFSAADAVQALQVVGIDGPGALTAGIRSTAYPMTELVTAITATYYSSEGTIPPAVWDTSRASAAEATCATPGLIDDAQARAELGRLLIRAFDGVPAADATNGAASVLRDPRCDASAPVAARVLSEVFPGLLAGDVVLALDGAGYDLQGSDGIAAALVTSLSQSVSQAADVLVAAGHSVDTTLRALASVPVDFGDLLGWVVDGRDPADLADVRHVVGTLEPIANGLGLALPQFLDDLVAGLGGSGQVPPCYPVVALTGIGHHPVTVLSAYDNPAHPNLYPGLLDPSGQSAMEEMAGCLGANGVNFDIPMVRFDVHFDCFHRPVTTVPVPQGVFVGQLEWSPGVTGLQPGQVIPPMPVYGSAPSDWHGGAYGLDSVDDNCEPTSRFPIWGGARTANPATVVVPDLPDPVESRLTLHASFFSKPRGDCSGPDHTTAGMAAAMALPPSLYPTPGDDRMAAASRTHVFRPGIGEVTVDVPMPIDHHGGCGRLNRGSSSATVRISEIHPAHPIDAALIGTRAVIQYHAFRGHETGLDVTAGIDLTGPELLAMLARGGYAPGTGAALGQYLTNGTF